MGKPNTPGCNDGGGCCGSVNCELLNDTYDRSDDTNLGAAWNEAAGGASISSNELLVSSNNSQIIGASGNPDDANTKIVVEFYLVSGTSTARVFLGWFNSVNYLYATVSATAITIGQAGSTSLSRPITIASGAWYTLTLCWNGTDLVATLDGREVSLSGLSTFGTKHGVGCGTASVRFNNFIATKVSGICSLCEIQHPPGTCIRCDSGEIDSYWQLEISGMTDGTCDHCEDLDGLYLFDDMQGNATICNAGPVTMPDPCTPYLGPSSIALRLEFHTYAGGDLGFVAQLTYPGLGAGAYYYNEFPPTPPDFTVDCEAVDGTVLPGIYLPFGSAHCTWTSATVTVGRWI